MKEGNFLSVTLWLMVFAWIFSHYLGEIRDMLQKIAHQMHNANQKKVTK